MAVILDCLIFTAACIVAEWNTAMYICDPSLLQGYTCINITSKIHTLDLRRTPTVTKLVGGKGISDLQVSSREWCRTEWANSVFYSLPGGDSGRCDAHPLTPTSASPEFQLLNANSPTPSPSQGAVSIPSYNFPNTTLVSTIRSREVQEKGGVNAGIPAWIVSTIRSREVQEKGGVNAGLARVGVVLGPLGLGATVILTYSIVCVWKCKKKGYFGLFFRLGHHRRRYRHHTPSSTSTTSSRRRLFSPISPPISFITSSEISPRGESAEPTSITSSEISPRGGSAEPTSSPSQSEMGGGEGKSQKVHERKPILPPSPPPPPSAVRDTRFKIAEPVQRPLTPPSAPETIELAHLSQSSAGSTERETHHELERPVTRSRTGSLPQKPVRYLE